MNYGAVNQSLVALRSEPFDRSEMVSQFLFGELFTVLEHHKEWLRVSHSLDSYEGWVDRKACLLISNEQLEWLSMPEITTIATKLFTAISLSGNHPIRLCPGSSLYHFDPQEETFRLGDETYKLLSSPFDPMELGHREKIMYLANQFINSPYLWGGRSPYGIDCSGLTQVLFKMIGYPLPRDASQQVAVGQPVSFIEQVQPGDLAFFDNDEGVVTHVGIVMRNRNIMHSSGFVKMDVLDQQGIYSYKSKTYTHKLRVVKDILSEIS